jgi:hypothetical protein
MKARIVRIRNKRYFLRKNPIYTPKGFKVAKEAIVDKLRDLSGDIKRSEITSTYFPPKEGKEKQPIRLEGDVSKNALADLIYYIADMLE